MAKRNDAFSRFYALPPLDVGTKKGNQTSFTLNLHRDKHSFFSGLQTPTFGVNQQQYSGPIIRARKGDVLTFRVNNQIGENTALHWHGLRLPAAMDGGPHQVIRPGETWVSRFKIRQAASTCWYHSHQHKYTGLQVYQGLAGMFIIDDDASDALNIPRRYGVDDLPVIIQDRDFNQDGSFRYVSTMPEKMHGKHGAYVMVNGVITPTLQAQSTLLRLRVMNGSNARIYHLTFHDKRPFQVIASDGGFLDRAATVHQQRLSPGERVELIVDVSDRREVILKSLRREGGGMGMMGGMFNDELDIMKIDARQAKKSPHPLPQALITPERLAPSAAKVQRSMEMSMSMHGMGMIRRMLGIGDTFTINGRSLDMKRIDFSVKRDVPEIWEVSNDSPMRHPFHVHNVQFQILSRNNGAVEAHETGLKDTVLINPGEKVRILLVFRDYADAKLPYMYHCHNLEHEDQGMMGQFTVV
ncbi:MAG: multicopper oxidase family protein [Thiolinea sp.]